MSSWTAHSASCEMDFDSVLEDSALHGDGGSTLAELLGSNSKKQGPEAIPPPEPPNSKPADASPAGSKRARDLHEDMGGLEQGSRKRDPGAPSNQPEENQPGLCSMQENHR